MTEDDIRMGIRMCLKTATEAEPVTARKISKKLRIAFATVTKYLPSVARGVGAHLVRVREGERGPMSKGYWVKK